MKVKRYKASDEKTILIALITHSGVLKRVARHIGSDKKPFRNKWSNVIARWCFDYFAKYRKAPGKTIQNLFVEYTKGTPDEDAAGIIESFLSSLSEDYKALARDINEEWVVDLASRFFEKVRLQRLSEGIEQAIERDDLDLARKAQTDYKPVAFADNDWIDPFTVGEVEDTLRHVEEDRSIIKFRGDLDRFLGPYFERDSFIAFTAAEKKGKSFWLLEIVWQAIRQRRRVLYYAIGDMSRRQVMTRLYCRAALRPKKDIKGLRIPTSIERIIKDEETGTRKAKVIFEERDYKAISSYEVKKAIKKLKAATASKIPLLRVYCEGASMITASRIEEDCEKYLEEHGQPPDLVVLDYADLVAPEPHTAKMEFRHQVDASWKVMRRISTRFHLCFVTATQAAARAYDQWLIRKKDSSEDKRKNAHVTGSLGINQTPEEKRDGIYRLNWTFLRDGEWTETDCIWTAGRLALACPCLKSCLPR